MRRSLSIGGSSSVQWRKVVRSWRFQMCFRRLFCVRIEIDQPQCVNCLVIIHCLSVSCTKINHSRCALVIWSSLQLTSKQWIITQQFTARADLFLNYISSIWQYYWVYVILLSKKRQWTEIYIYILHLYVFDVYCSLTGWTKVKPSRVLISQYLWDNKRNKSHELLKAGYDMISIRNNLRNIIMLKTLTYYIWLSYG